MNNEMSQTEIIRRVISLDMHIKDMKRAAYDAELQLFNTIAMAAKAGLDEGPYVVDDCVVTFDFEDKHCAEITPVQYTNDEKREWSEPPGEAAP